MLFLYPWIYQSDDEYYLSFGSKHQDFTMDFDILMRDSEHQGLSFLNNGRFRLYAPARKFRYSFEFDPLIEPESFVEAVAGNSSRWSLRFVRDHGQTVGNAYFENKTDALLVRMKL